MTDSPVTIFGESGTGREHVAREIHKHSPRAQGPFVVLDCSGRSVEELERDLFGNLKAAAGGTLLLKHVNEMPAVSQLKLARIIEKRPTETRSGAEPHFSDIRFIAAIDGDRTASSSVRSELLFVLSIIQIVVPPLRRRSEDFPELVQHLCDQIARRVKKTLTVAPGAVEFLRRHDWPGNVRELANVLERAAVNSPTGNLVEEDFAELVATKISPARVLRPLAEVEREHILSAFAQCGGNVEKTATVLKLDTASLKRKLDAFASAEPAPMEAAVVCVACGMGYTVDEARELENKCPRCASVEGAMLMPTSPTTSFLPAHVPRFENNRYVVYKLLGRSASSEVWAGWQPTLCRRVIIKMPIEGNPEALERFKREARLHATLKHPNIPAVYEANFGEKMFLATEFIEGLPLDDFNQRLSQKNQEPNRIQTIVGLVRQSAGALHYMHAQRLVHRDVKPNNILATGEEKAYLIDYGLAKAVNVTDVVTAQGYVLGTLPFMSPEQVRGEEVDTATDVWGLGATLYFLLTGRFPFYGSRSDEVMGKIQSNDPDPPAKINPAISKKLERALLRAMEKVRSDRFSSAAEFADAIL